MGNGLAFTPPSQTCTALTKRVPGGEATTLRVIGTSSTVWPAFSRRRRGLSPRNPELGDIFLGATTGYREGDGVSVLALRVNVDGARVQAESPHGLSVRPPHF